jgi:hypothetical protein
LIVCSCAGEAETEITILRDDGGKTLSLIDFEEGFKIVEKFKGKEQEIFNAGVCENVKVGGNKYGEIVISYEYIEIMYVSTSSINSNTDYKVRICEYKFPECLIEGSYVNVKGCPNS